MEKFRIAKPPRLAKNHYENLQKIDIPSEYFHATRNCQTFVFNADEVSLAALLDPNFNPMTVIERHHHHQSQGDEQQRQRQPSIPIVYPENYPKSASANPTARYERASFDPYADLAPAAPFLTIPTRRRHLILNDPSIVRL